VSFDTRFLEASTPSTVSGAIRLEKTPGGRYLDFRFAAASGPGGRWPVVESTRPVVCLYTELEGQSVDSPSENLPEQFESGL
jgi:hypothetical protein